SAYPLLYLATGFLTWRAIRDASPPALIAFLILAGATSTTVLFGTPWVPSALLVAAIGAVVLLPALLAQREDAHPRLTRAARSIAALAVAGVLLAAAAESFDLANVYALI
ncbi:MAG TPA: hypothetical protein VG245_05930, partial [Candidatus Dormibacteraeota bacterium]|nr:hypothetical protein [Candidatus Dormibacteraeota bacterium]